MTSSLQVMLLAYGAVVSTDASNDIDPLWLSRAKAEIRVSLEKYRSLSRLIDESAEFRTEKDPSATDAKFKNRTTRTSSSQLNNNSLFETITTFDNEKDKRIVRLDCSNEDYQFSLQRESLDSPYVLVRYAAVKPGDPIGWAGGGYLNVFDALPLVLGAVESRDGYVLKLIRWDNRKQLLHVRLDAKRGSLAKPFFANEDVWLDPTNNWRVIQTDVKTPSSITHTHITYGPPVDGLSFPVEFLQTTTPSIPEKAPYHIRGTMNVSKTNKSPRDFRLSAFGLPEPGGLPAEKKIPNYIWVLAAAGVCAILAAGFRYLARRKRPRPAT